MSDAQIFQKAFEIVSNPATFCTGQNAVDAMGNGVAPESDTACRWCSYGALCAAGAPSEFRRRVRAAFVKIFHSDPEKINDEKSHDEVVWAWRRVGEEHGWLS